MNLSDKFEFYLSEWKTSHDGYVSVDFTIFEEFVQEMKTPEDVEHIKQIVADTLGHKNTITNVRYDNLMKKGITVHPVGMLDFFKYHRELMYYPHPEIIDLYVDYFTTQKDYEQNAKKLIEVTLKEYWLKKTSNYYNRLISVAHENHDFESVRNLYCDILEYSQTKLDVSTINYVLDAVEKENKALSDHVLKYISEHQIEMNFTTHLLAAAHAHDLDQFNERIKAALNYTSKSGECHLAKSELIKSEVFSKYKDHETSVQALIDKLPIDKVCPHNDGFYEWTYAKYSEDQNQENKAEAETPKAE